MSLPLAAATTVLLVAETLLLVLLSVLVAGLLRSHAEILRRLGPGEETAGGGTSDADLPSPPDRAPGAAATDVAGSTLDDEALQIGLGAGGDSTLLAFLSSGCLTCEGFWDAFRHGRRPEIPGGARLVIVTKDTTHESPSRLRELAPRDVPVVMSSAAWQDYDVPTAPYFVFVDGPSGMVTGEGAASGWPQVESLLRDALDDIAVIERRPGDRGRATSGRSGSGAERISRADRELESAGIGPGHPSLWPGDTEGRQDER